MNIDAILSASLSTTAPDHDEPTTTTKVVAYNAPDGSQAAPKGAPPPPVAKLPCQGSISAQEFLRAIVRAKGRDEAIALIAGYCGWNPHRDFASQDREARLRAQRELRPITYSGPTAREINRAAALAGGFVAGLPSPASTLIANLQARRVAAVELLLQAKTPGEAKTAQAVIDGINAALSQLGGQ